MLVNPCVVLDAAMPVSEVLTRLARQGFWLDSQHPAVRPVIEESARRLKLPSDEVEQKLYRWDFYNVGTAIRRQWYANIMWYARPLYFVMEDCYRSEPDLPLHLALNLQENESVPLIDMPMAGEVPDIEGVIIEGNAPVAVSVENWGAPPPEELACGKSPVERKQTSAVKNLRAGLRRFLSWGSATRSISRGKDVSMDVESTEIMADPAAEGLTEMEEEEGRGLAIEPREVRAWPRIDVPTYVPARKPFDVTVGLAMAMQTGVTGGQVVFQPPPGVKKVDIEVSLIADGLDAPEGWSKILPITVDDPSSTHVIFRLIGHDPTGPEPVQLVTLEVRYSYDGSVCGIASRPLVIGSADAPTFNLPQDYGTQWLTQPETASSITVRRDPDVADLTIEIFKPDGNPAKGSYVCRLYSPHSLASEMGPFPIELDDDAQSFAKAIVHQVRMYANSPAVDNLLESHGRLVADKLGLEVINVLREVAAHVAPEPAAVLLVSAEPYVPWELAFIDSPFDLTRPKYLGAQVMLGRWLRDRERQLHTSNTNDFGSASTARSIDRPPVQPPAQIDVEHMAVMAGMYKAESGLRRLPEAEREATDLLKTYDAVPLAASLQAVKQLLDARLEHKFVSIGGVETIHFAGHGEYDASNPDAAVLFLSDGMPLYASLFRSAKYGGDRTPLFFLNACMAGIGDQLLGDMGGFPGNCLKGGFGGVLGALWEIDDAMAHEVAIEFWKRALPLSGTKAEPVGAILRDLRAKYVPDPAAVPATTYLAYVYYGHPRLTLQMAS